MGQMTSWQRQLETIIAPAVAQSTSIDAIDIDSGNLERSPVLIREHLGNPKAGVVIVADENTHKAAGERLEAAFATEGIASERFVYDAIPRLKPSLANAKAMLPALESHGGIIIAVGSGVINDLVKYAAYRLGRPYACVATAASMDGYASAGSPLSDQGFKHTIACAPPRVLVADMDVLAKAPEEMTGWGYGDLAGKVAAGADWIVADRLGIEEKGAFTEEHLDEWLSLKEDRFRYGKSEHKPKVFGLGLSRTGTRSLTGALQVLGFDTVHYPIDEDTFNELSHGQYDLTILKNQDGLTDITVSPYYTNLLPGYMASSCA